MNKHQIEIDLTVLKELVIKYWTSEAKEKYFRSYTDKNGKLHNIITAELCLPEPRYAEKADGSKIESETSVLQNTGFCQISEKVGDEWMNQNFARLQQWVTKVDMTPPNKQLPIGETINPSDIPF